MTPAARLAAAAALLDEINDGRPVEQVLTNWARRSRFAGSKDRAAVRDLVFDAVRCRRSLAALGGGMTGRALMIGWVRAQGGATEDYFTGEGHALAPLTAEEGAAGRAPQGAEALDVPDWLVPELRASLGDDLDPICDLMRRRADLYLRWNAARTDATEAIARLADDGIAAEPHALAPRALRVTDGARRVAGSEAYRTGRVELQDAASQAVCAALPVCQGTRVLDYCAGGGGKSLALAAEGAAVIAHDVDPSRMRDLPVRAARAGTEIQTAHAEDLARRGPFDVVLADVPCSGSGAWRRQAEAKWRLTAERLEALTRIQGEILLDARRHVRPGGHLAYVTCSLLRAENEDRVARWRADAAGAGLETVFERRISPLEGGDGFYVALFKVVD